MSQNLPVGVFKYVENTHQFYKDFIKTVMKIVMKDIFLKLMFSTLYPTCMMEKNVYIYKM